MTKLRTVVRDKKAQAVAAQQKQRSDKLVVIDGAEYVRQHTAFKQAIVTATEYLTPQEILDMVVNTFGGCSWRMHVSEEAAHEA
jgi:hypothetical protein